MLRKLYPGGRTRAFNISYDDGVLQDTRFVAMLNLYGLKGTFNLNSSLMKQEFTWIHENGMPVTRLSEKAAVRLYEGHEIASHTATHPYMHDLTETDVLQEMWADRYALSRIFGRDVDGFALPFTYFSDLIEDCARKAGFAYARISEESNSYAVPENFFRWRAGKFHWSEDLERYVEGFLRTDAELAICQIVGHSYDLDAYRMWDRMEAIFRRVSMNETVWPATHIAIVRYLRSMEQAVIAPDGIFNLSANELWFHVDGKTVMLPPGESFRRNEL